MQKRANRILSMLLALIMVMTMLPATVFANSETDVFAGWSLTLGEDIGVNFYLAEEAANYTVDVTVAGNKAAYTTATKDGYYVVSVNVAAAQMTDVITLNVKNGDTQVHTGEYSVRQYAEKILTGAYDAEVKELVKQMLNLGAAAQTYFAYNTDPLANKGYEIDTPAAVPTEVPAIALEDNLDGVSLYGMSLLFQSKTAVRFYFVVDGDVANYTFKVGGEACEVKNSEDLYYVEIGDINPQDLGNEITVTVNDALSVSYNPLTYIVRKYNSDSSSAALKNLVQAMYGYHLAAKKYASIIWAGTMSSHSNGWSADALYFSMAENEAPIGDAIRYKPEAASNLKLIRDGVTYDVGHTARETIVKSSDTGYYIALWVLGDYKPLVANDILVVEGNFTNAANNTTLNISKSYVLINADGTASFSTEMPTLTTVIDAGTMSAHSTTGWKSSAEAAGNLLFAMADNDAPSGYYRPTDASNVQLIRGGNTYVVGHNLRDTISKENNAQYVFEFWTIADHKPMVANDILVVEGDFYQESTKTMLNISKTYILLNADGTASFSTEMPTPTTVIDAGVMSAHADGSASEIYFSLSENAVPVDENAETAYTGSVQLVRSGAVSTVSANIYKLDEGYYYLELDGVELADGDYLVVEGAFSNADNGYTMNITKTYVLADGDKLVYSETEPVLSTTIDAGVMSKHSVNGWASNGVYASMAENAAPFDGWSVEYSPVASENLKLIRGGQTYNIGFPGRGTLVKYNATDYFLKMEWNVGEYAPMQDGDVLIVEGGFVHAASNTTLNISKTYIYADGNNVFFNPILAGAMSNHANGVSGDGIYASMAENAAPYDDWNIEYTPVTADSYYVIRNGEQINIGIPGRGTLVKYGDTNYFLKINSWCTNNFAYTTDDIIVVDGFWRQNTQGSAIMKIEKTYLYYNGSAWTFATELPSVISGGTMQTHTKGMWGYGISFTMAANNAPFNSDWTLEYKQTSTDNIKIIRGGETISIGIVDRPLIIKISNDEYYLKLEGWTIGNYGLNSTSPITTDDVIIVEGNFVYENVTLNVTKSYVYYNGSAWVCAAEAPALKNVVDVVKLGSHSNGWKTGGFYFTAAANDAPYDDWSLRYKPVSADVIKLIKADGTTTNVGNTGGETIVKYSDTEYYVEGWAIGSANLVAGNTFVIEGQFYNAANNVYINVEKTYITLNAGGTITVVNKFVDNEADTEFGKVVLPTSNKNMTIGMWNGSYHVFEHKQLQELQAAGITKIMGIDTQWIGTTDVNAWLDRVYSYGISVIMDLRNWDGKTVPSYASHPGVLGFLMYDEPSAKNFSALANLKEKFDAVMPADKLFYVNLFPECAADSSLFGSIINIHTDYDQYYVTKFLETVGVEVLSWDNYSLLSGSGIRTDYYHNFEVMASKTAEKWYTMLSSGHNTTSTSYATPTAEELRWQMAVAMTYGVQNIDHYTYVSHEKDYSCMVEYDTWKPTALYYDILQVDNEYLAWDNIFMAYNWIGVGTYSANSNNSMLTQLENSLNLANYGITATSASENLLIGVFENNSNKAYMVTNAGSAGSTTVGDGKNFSMADTSVTLTLADGNYKCAAIIDQGEITYVAVNNNQIVLDVEAYEGVFVIPVLN